MTGEGKSFKYEFDWSKARIPALAAVSPNLDIGPAVKSIPYIRNWKSIRELTLDNCSANALIVSPKSSVVVECLSRGGEGSSKTVLVVHNSSKRLQNTQSDGEDDIRE